MDITKAMLFALLSAAIVAIVFFVLGVIFEPIQNDIKFFLGNYLLEAIIIFVVSILIVGTGFYAYYHDKARMYKEKNESLLQSLEQAEKERDSYHSRCERLMKEYRELERERAIRNALGEEEC